MTAYTERVVQFGPDNGRVGVITEPVDRAPAASLLILGAGILHRVGPSRAAVYIARHLATHGVRSLRFDHAGIGDSDRGQDRLRESVLRDVRDGVDLLLREAGPAASQVSVLGFCSGADTAIVCAGKDARIAAIALFDPLVPQTVSHYARALGDRLARATISGLVSRALDGFRPPSPTPAPPPPDYFGLVTADRSEFASIMQTLTDRRVRRLWLMTREVLGYCSDPRQIAEALGAAASEELDEVAWHPEADHVLSTQGQIELLCRRLTAWIAKPIASFAAVAQLALIGL